MTAVLGRAELTSQPLSTVWTLSRDDQLVCVGRRRDLRHPHRIEFQDGRIWEIERLTFDSIALIADGVQLAVATRTDPRGRWQIAGPTFSFDLHPQSVMRHRWTLSVGGQPVATIRGGLMSFNRMSIDTTLPVPLEALWLAWAAMVHAWRAAGGPERS